MVNQLRSLLVCVLLSHWGGLAASTVLSSLLYSQIGLAISISYGCFLLGIFLFRQPCHSDLPSLQIATDSVLLDMADAESALGLGRSMHCWRWVVFPPEKPIKRHVLWFPKGFSHGNTKSVSERKIRETHYVFLLVMPKFSSVQFSSIFCQTENWTD